MPLLEGLDLRAAHNPGMGAWALDAAERGAEQLLGFATQLETTHLTVLNLRGLVLFFQAHAACV